MSSGPTRPLAKGDYEACLRSPRDVSVHLNTQRGPIDIRLYGSKAPVTTCNFLRYVEAGAFSGGSFYRTVRPDNQQDKPVRIDVIQADVRKDSLALSPIHMESTAVTGLHHVDGAISMARDGPDTATSSFFLCIGPQPELDFGGHRNPDGQGFAAFGRVTRGMDTVRKIWMQRAQGEDMQPPILITGATVSAR